MRVIRSRRPRSARSSRGLVAALLAVVLTGVSTANAAEGQPAKKDTPAPIQRLIEPFVSFSTSVEPARARPGETVTYKVTTTLQNPWHIYGYAKEQPQPPAPRNTQFDLFETGGLEPVGDWKSTPEAERKPEPAFDNRVFGIHEGKVVWSQSLKVPADATPGQRSIISQVYFQICDPTSCKPPTYKSLEPAELTILPGGGSGQGAAAGAGTEGASRTSTDASDAGTAAPGPATEPQPESVATVPSPANDEGEAASGEARESSRGDTAAVVASTGDRQKSEVERKIGEGLIPFLLFSRSEGSPPSSCRASGRWSP